MADTPDPQPPKPAASFTATMLGLAAVMFGSGLSIGTLMFRGRTTPLPVPARLNPIKYTLLWVNPDTNMWEIYQPNLSQRRVLELQRRVRYGRWFDHNPATRIVLDGVKP